MTKFTSWKPKKKEEPKVKGKCFTSQPIYFYLTDMIELE